MAMRNSDLNIISLMLVTASDDKTAKLWLVARKKFISTFHGHTNWVRCARFSPVGRLIATCSDDKTIRLYDQNSSQCVHTFQEIKGSATHVEFHPNGTCIASGMTNNVVKVYDVLLQHYRSHEGPVTKVAFHPCGNYLLTASQDSSMRVLDLLEGRPIYTLQGHDGAITAVAFSASGEYFASGGSDAQLLVWRTNFDKEDLLKECLRKNEHSVMKESFSDFVTPTHKVDERSAVSKDLHGPGVHVSFQVTNVDSRSVDNLAVSNTAIEDSATTCCASGTTVNKSKSNMSSMDGPSSSLFRDHIALRRPLSVHTTLSTPSTGTTNANSVVQTLENVCNQVETLRKTVMLLEQRLTLVEDKLQLPSHS